VTAPKPFTGVLVYVISYDQSGTSWFDGVTLRNA
jgi:hypothetical protein